ncbi:MAG: hypothetical protein BWY75_01165 [bacterium ADurb.Bin425]|nr:MAG: hypothetical protein BWY75_01165 [bacterium ADurb.Bin425]
MLCLCGQTSGRTTALYFHNNHRHFHDAGHTYCFGHEGKSTTGGCTHGSDAGDTGTNSHVDHRQFVFALLDANAGLGCMACHPVQDCRSRGHRISAVELTSGSIGTECNRFVAGDERTLLMAELPLFGERLAVCFGKLETSFEQANVQIDYFLAFVAESIGQNRSGLIKTNIGQIADSADGYCVLHDRLQRTMSLNDFFCHFRHRQAENLDAFSYLRRLAFDSV